MKKRKKGGEKGWLNIFIKFSYLEIVCQTTPNIYFGGLVKIRKRWREISICKTKIWFVKIIFLIYFTKNAR